MPDDHLSAVRVLIGRGTRAGLLSIAESTVWYGTESVWKLEG